MEERKCKECGMLLFGISPEEADKKLRKHQRDVHLKQKKEQFVETTM